MMIASAGACTEYRLFLAFRILYSAAITRNCIIRFRNRGFEMYT